MMCSNCWSHFELVNCNTALSCYNAKSSISCLMLFKLSLVPKRLFTKFADFLGLSQTLFCNSPHAPLKPVILIFTSTVTFVMLNQLSNIFSHLYTQHHKYLSHIYEFAFVWYPVLAKYSITGHCFIHNLGRVSITNVHYYSMLSQNQLTLSMFEENIFLNIFSNILCLHY